MVADLPPAPVDTLRQVPILYDATTGQPIGGVLQRYANRFKLPTGGEARVVLGREPGKAEPASYVRGITPDQDRLYYDWGWYRGDPKRDRRDALYHELAHRYDRRFADQTVRDRFTQIMGLPTDWENGVNGANVPKEQFAEAIAVYHLNRRYKRAKRHLGGYDYTPTRKQFRQVRRLFDGIQ